MRPAAHPAASCAGRSCRARSAPSGSVSTGTRRAVPPLLRQPRRTARAVQHAALRQVRQMAFVPVRNIRDRREHRLAGIGPCRIDQRVDIIRQPDPDRQQFANARLRQRVKRQHADQPLPCPRGQHARRAGAEMLPPRHQPRRRLERRRARHAPPQRGPFRQQVPHLRLGADAHYPHGCCAAAPV